MLSAGRYALVSERVTIYEYDFLVGDGLRTYASFLVQVGSHIRGYFSCCKSLCPDLERAAGCDYAYAISDAFYDRGNTFPPNRFLDDGAS